MDASTKERLIGELSDYLDTLPDTPPAAQEATREVDLYFFFTELAGLRNEVRLEWRALYVLLHSAYPQEHTHPGD